MQNTLTPNLTFQGACQDAIAFYAAALDAEVLSCRTLGDTFPPELIRNGTPDSVLRAVLRIGQSIVYLSDGHSEARPGSAGISLSLALASEDEAHRRIAALAADGGRVQVPLRETTWAGLYGTVFDRFGVHWSIEVPPR